MVNLTTLLTAATDDRYLDGPLRVSQHRLPRRAALRAGVAGAIALAAVGVGRDGGRAMPAMAPPIAFRGAVRSGLSAGLALAGTLWLNLGPGGEIPFGELVGEEGDRLATAAGQADGHALDLRLRLADGRLSAIGVLDLDVYAGEGSAGGVLTGPLPGDLGDWQGTYLPADTEAA